MQADAYEQKWMFFYWFWRNLKIDKLTVYKVFLFRKLSFDILPWKCSKVFFLTSSRPTAIKVYTVITQFLELKWDNFACLERIFQYIHNTFKANEKKK